VAAIDADAFHYIALRFDRPNRWMSLITRMVWHAVEVCQAGTLCPVISYRQHYTSLPRMPIRGFSAQPSLQVRSGRKPSDRTGKTGGDHRVDYRTNILIGGGRLTLGPFKAGMDRSVLPGRRRTRRRSFRTSYRAARHVRPMGGAAQRGIVPVQSGNNQVSAPIEPGTITGWPV